ncbi:unnamed protein product [Didymodactylos carnosus]|uniref:NAD-dependent epimerase/dehydratase domain-containing protein n=1 Tax=Didymodactylos carnosus TaxID=1234261 RepID=A0A8S2E0S6_9BILA|nr:unnamed protein product [Didymodactylos carnosus]CAF3817651.1 unnamed protein product [Didymodactylos carnosus]
MGLTQRQRESRFAGGTGFIGSHLAKQLKKEGHYVIITGRTGNKYFEENELCDEFFHGDLRILENCIKATAGCDWVFNLAADTGGMGFIQTNHSVILWNNTMISFNMLEAARKNSCKRFFYASSAFVYPQAREEFVCLREDDAWTAKPQDSYGLEKLVSEEAAMHYANDFPIATRIGRFHNVYGPQDSWKGGREKVIAAFCRKVLVANEGGNNGEMEIWGDGKQSRSFCYIDDCVEGIIRLMVSDYDQPLNIGSDEMVSMDQLCDYVAAIEKKYIIKKHISGPVGVRGRCSNNTRIKEVLNWAPSISLKEGLKKTYEWIKTELENEKVRGIDISQYASSKVVVQTTDTLQQIGYFVEKD